MQIYNIYKYICICKYTYIQIYMSAITIDVKRVCDFEEE